MVRIVIVQVGNIGKKVNPFNVHDRAICMSMNKHRYRFGIYIYIYICLYIYIYNMI